MDSPPENLDDILKKLLLDIPEVKAAAIVTTEGLPIASVLPQGVDETRLAALTAVLHSSAKQSIIEMKKGEFDPLYVKGSNGYLLVRQAGPNALLIVSTTLDARLGLIFLGSDPKSAGVAYEKIISIMKKESISELSIKRQYLPEILSDAVLKISSDGFPALKRFAIAYFLLGGIKTEYYGNVVKFIKKSYFQL